MITHTLITKRKVRFTPSNYHKNDFQHSTTKQDNINSPTTKVMPMLEDSRVMQVEASLFGQ